MICIYDSTTIYFVISTSRRITRMNNVEHQEVIRPSEMILDPNVIPCDALGSTLGFKRKVAMQISITRLRLEQSKRTRSEVQLSFAGLRHFSDQQLEDLMTHLPRGVQVFHLDASWLLDHESELL